MKKALLFLIIPVVLCDVGIWHITRQQQAEVNVLKASVRPGFETVAAEYDVTASPAYRWRHGGHSTALVIAGHLLFILAAIYIYLVEEKVWDHSWLLLIVIWLLAGICLFGKYSFNYFGDRYSKRFTEQQYMKHADNPDLLFEK